MITEISSRATVAVIIFSLAVLTSCRKPDQEMTFDLSLDSANATALPFNQKSCTDIVNSATTGSLGEASADFKYLNFSWSGQKAAGATIDIQSITIQLRSNYLKSEFSKVFTADELKDIFQLQPLSISGNDTTKRKTDCYFRIGGIQFADPAKPAFAQGKLKLFAIFTDTDGTQEPIYSETDLSVKYFGKQ